jgi:Skp family chaperone for outer membrane proteins
MNNEKLSHQDMSDKALAQQPAQVIVPLSRPFKPSSFWDTGLVVIGVAGILSITGIYIDTSMKRSVRKVLEPIFNNLKKEINDQFRDAQSTSNARFAGIRLASIEAQIRDNHGATNARFAGIEAQTVRDVQDTCNGRFSGIELQFRDMQHKFDNKLDKKFAHVDSKLKVINAKVTALIKFLEISNSDFVVRDRRTQQKENKTKKELLEKREHNVNMLAQEEPL